MNKEIGQRIIRSREKGSASKNFAIGVAALGALALVGLGRVQPTEVDARPAVALTDTPTPTPTIDGTKVALQATVNAIPRNTDTPTPTATVDGTKVALQATVNAINAPKRPTVDATTVALQTTVDAYRANGSATPTVEPRAAATRPVETQGPDVVATMEARQAARDQRLLEGEGLIAKLLAEEQKAQAFTASLIQKLLDRLDRDNNGGQGPAVATSAPTSAPYVAPTSRPTEAVAATATIARPAATQTRVEATATTQAPSAEVTPAQAVDGKQLYEGGIEVPAGQESNLIGMYIVPTGVDPDSDDVDPRIVHNRFPDLATDGEFSADAFPSSHGEFTAPDGRKFFVDDYGIFWAHNGQGVVEFLPGVGPGQVIARMKKGVSNADLNMALITNKEFTDKHGHKTGIFMKKMDQSDGKEYQNLPAQVSFKGGQPEVAVEVQVWSKDGKQLLKTLRGITSPDGDITISLPDDGLVVIQAKNYFDPSHGTLEVVATVGPDKWYGSPDPDRQQDRVDASGYGAYTH